MNLFNRCDDFFAVGTIIGFHRKSVKKTMPEFSAQFDGWFALWAQVFILTPKNLVRAFDISLFHFLSAIRTSHKEFLLSHRRSILLLLHHTDEFIFFKYKYKTRIHNQQNRMVVTEKTATMSFIVFFRCYHPILWIYAVCSERVSAAILINHCNDGNLHLGTLVFRKFWFFQFYYICCLKCRQLYL